MNINLGLKLMVVRYMMHNLTIKILANIIFGTFINCRSSVEYYKSSQLFLLADDLSTFDLGHAGSKFY